MEKAKKSPCFKTGAILGVEISVSSTNVKLENSNHCVLSHANNRVQQPRIVCKHQAFKAKLSKKLKNKSD